MAPAGTISPIASVTFNEDFVAPSGTITYPAANATISSATIQMTGPESDDLSGVNLTKVEISDGIRHELVRLDRGSLGAQSKRRHAHIYYHDHGQSLVLYHSQFRAGANQRPIDLFAFCS